MNEVESELWVGPGRKRVFLIGPRGSVVVLARLIFSGYLCLEISALHALQLDEQQEQGHLVFSEFAHSRLVGHPGTAAGDAKSGADLLETHSGTLLRTDLAALTFSHFSLSFRGALSIARTKPRPCTFYRK